MTAAERHAVLDRRARGLVRVICAFGVCIALMNFLPWEWGRPWAMLGALAVQLGLFWWLIRTLKARTAARLESLS